MIHLLYHFLRRKRRPAHEFLLWNRSGCKGIQICVIDKRVKKVLELKTPISSS